MCYLGEIKIVWRCVQKSKIKSHWFFKKPIVFQQVPLFIPFLWKIIAAEVLYEYGPCTMSLPITIIHTHELLVADAASWLVVVGVEGVCDHQMGAGEVLALQDTPIQMPESTILAHFNTTHPTILIHEIWYYVPESKAWNFLTSNNIFNTYVQVQNLLDARWTES